MGYDMTWRKSPGSEVEEAVADARRHFDQCVNERDKLAPNSPESEAAQQAVEKAYDEPDRADVSYFRLNMWGMRHCREHMAKLEMIYPSQPEGDWPDYDEALDGEADKLAADSTPRAEWPAEVLAYKETHEAFLASGVQERPGIAVHKFGSNDGWIVTPVECMGAVEQWKRAVLGPPELGPGNGDRRVSVLLAKATDRAVTPFESEAFVAKAIELAEKNDLPEWWAEWIAFLVGAAQHGGFEVF